LLALAVAAGTVAGCGGGLPSDAVAKVGGTVILKSDFDKRVQEFAAQYQVASKEDDPSGWAQFQSDVLEYMITYEMVVQEAKKDSLTVTDAELQTQIDSIVTQYYAGDNAKFTADLTANNMTLDQLKLNYRESMLMQKVYDKVTANVTVADADIAAYYDKNKATYFVPESRTTRHILIKPGTPATNPPTTTTTAPWGSTTTQSTTTTESTTTTTVAPTDADWAAALATAQEVRQLLVAGGDWTKLAAEYSDDTSTANSGGALGDVSKNGQMVKEFEDAVFSLKLNEISQPVKSVYGYHVIEVTAINAAKQSTLDEVKADIKSQLLDTAKKAEWDKWIAATKKQTGVIYQKGMEPTTTTTGSATSTTAGTGATGAGETITTAAGETITTAAGETITTAAGETITTAAGETITTAAGETITTAAGETITTSGGASTTATTAAADTTTTAKP
jgi:foldase protein PrsA